MADAATSGESGRVGASELTSPDDLLAAAEGDGPVPLVRGRVVDSEGVGIEAQIFASTGWGWVQPPLDMEDDGIASDGWQQLAKTDADGQGWFELDAPLLPGTLRLAVRAPGFAPRSLEGLRVNEARPNRIADIVMEPGVTLAGRVIDRRGDFVAGVQLLQVIERGVGGHKISVPGRGVPLGETDGNGNFEVGGVAAGSWGMILDSPDHLALVVRGQTAEPGVQDGLMFVLEDGDTITGKVVGVSAERASRLRVEARPTSEERRRTDITVMPRARRAELEGDAFVLSGLQPILAHRLTVWELEEDGRYQRAWDIQSAEAYAGDRDVKLEARVRASVTLRAVDEAGNPVEEFAFAAGTGTAGRVYNWTLEKADERAVRDHPGGKATLEGLSVGEKGGVVTVKVLAPGFAEFTKSEVPIQHGEELDLGDVVLESAPLVRVIVTSKLTGEPVEDARVMLAPPDQKDGLEWLARAPHANPWDAGVRGHRTGADGVARMNLPEAGNGFVVVTAEGYVASEMTEVRGKGQEAIDLEVELGSGGMIVATVRTPSGDPMPGVVLRAEPEDEGVTPLSYASSGGNATGPDGTTILGPLDPARWSVQVRHEAGQVEAEPIEVQVLAGTEHTVTFTLEPRVTLTGRVTEGRVPLAGADLTLTRAGDNGRGRRRGGSRGESAISQFDGTYRFDDLPVGEYNLRVAHPERYMSDTFEVTVAPGGSYFDVELSNAAVEGRISYPDGSPVVGQRVRLFSADGRGGGWSGGMELIEDEHGQLEPDWRSREHQVNTDGDGRYRFQGLPSDVGLTVSVSARHLTSARSELVTLAPGELAAGIDLTVQAAGAVQARLAPGTSGGYRVTAKRADGSKGQRPSTSLWGGRSRTLEGMLPGEWNLEVVPRQDGVTEPVLVLPVTVTAGVTTEVTLTIP